MDKNSYESGFDDGYDSAIAFMTQKMKQRESLWLSIQDNLAIELEKIKKKYYDADSKRANFYRLYEESKDKIAKMEFIERQKSRMEE